MKIKYEFAHTTEEVNKLEADIEDMIYGDPKEETNHYNGRECYEWIKQCIKANPTLTAIEGAYLFNVLKYLFRFTKKESKIRDLKKSRDYLDELIRECEND